MSIQANNFNDRKAEQELKSCPKIVRDYVRLLKEAIKRQQELTARAISKIQQQADWEERNPVGGQKPTPAREEKVYGDYCQCNGPKLAAGTVVGQLWCLRCGKYCSRV